MDLLLQTRAQQNGTMLPPRTNEMEKRVKEGGMGSPAMMECPLVPPLHQAARTSWAYDDNSQSVPAVRFCPPCSSTSSGLGGSATG